MIDKSGNNGYQKMFPAEESLTFDGGLDTKFEKALLPVNESPDCLNVEFINGAVQTRQGAVKLNTTPVSAGGSCFFDGMYTRRANDGSTESLTVFAGGTMWALGTTTFNTIGSAQSVFTAGIRVGAENAENYLFIGNGGVGPYKYNGTDFTQHGISAPVATMAANSGTTGSLTTGATYYYVYTNVNSALVESNISPVRTFVVTSTGNGLAANLTSISVGSFPSQGVSQRWVYRSQANTPGAFFRITKLLDNTTTTFTDTTADANLLSAAPTDNGTPPKYNVIFYLGGYLFTNDAANPNFVWFSNAFTPYTFASTNFFRVGDNAGDLVKGFSSQGGNLVIFCENSTWINYMDGQASSSTWSRLKTTSPYGSKSPYSLLNCVVQGVNLVLHPAVQNRKFVGFAALSGSTVAPSSTFLSVTNAGSDLQSQVIEPDMFNVNYGDAPIISGIIYKNRAFLSVPFGSSQTTNNRIYVWDFSLSNMKKDQVASWSPWSGTQMSVTQFAIFGGKLYGCTSTSSGFVYQVADTQVYSDDGNAINSYWWSKEYSGYDEDTSFMKDWRYINMLFDAAGSYPMGIAYRADSDNSAGTTQNIDLSSGGSTWGTMIWGVDQWGGGVLQTEKRVFFGSLRGKRLQIQFNNQNKAGQRFAVHRAQFMYNIRGYR